MHLASIEKKKSKSRLGLSRSKNPTSPEMSKLSSRKQSGILSNSPEPDLVLMKNNNEIIKEELIQHM